MKKFITVNENGRVELIHYMPFDSQHGFGKSEGELSQMGILLDEIPNPEIIEGKRPIAMYDSVSGFYYKYENINTESKIYLR